MNVLTPLTTVALQYINVHRAPQFALLIPRPPWRKAIYVTACHNKAVAITRKNTTAVESAHVPSLI